MNTINNFLETNLFLKIKEILSITGDTEFFKIITTCFIKSGHLIYHSNLINYFNALLEMQNAYAGKPSTTYKDKLANFITSDFYEKIKEILNHTKDIEFFNLITNYLLDAGILIKNSNLYYYFNELETRGIITKADIANWYLKSIHVDLLDDFQISSCKSAI